MFTEVTLLVSVLMFPVTCCCAEFVNISFSHDGTSEDSSQYVGIEALRSSDTDCVIFVQRIHMKRKIILYLHMVSSYRMPISQYRKVTPLFFGATSVFPNFCTAKKRCIGSQLPCGMDVNVSPATSTPATVADKLLIRVSQRQSAV